MHANLKLQSFTQADFKTLIAWVPTEISLKQFAGPLFTYPLTEEQLLQNLEDPNRLVFKVVDTLTDSALGHAEIYHNQDNSVRLCRVLIGEEEFRGRGLGQEIIKMLVSFSLNELGVSMVELNVYDWNIGAIKCYEKVGFILNSAHYTIIAVAGEEWKSVRMDWEGKV